MQVTRTNHITQHAQAEARPRWYLHALYHARGMCLLDSADGTKQHWHSLRQRQWWREPRWDAQAVYRELCPFSASTGVSCWTGTGQRAASAASGVPGVMPISASVR
jgi:hypothetical protein